MTDAMKTSRILRNITILASVILLGTIAAWWFLRPGEHQDSAMRRALISEITPMV